jgi:hypothetical protein
MCWYFTALSGHHGWLQQAPTAAVTQPPFLCSPLLRALSGRYTSTSAPACSDFVSLNTIGDNPGATHYVRRIPNSEREVLAWCMLLHNMLT